MNKSYFSEKDNVVFYVPTNIDDQERDTFLIELIECIEGYIHPLEFGMYSNDFIDFVDSKEMDIYKFMREKRYIVADIDFVLLAKRYGLDNRGYRLTMTNCLSMKRQELRYHVVDVLNLLIEGNYENTPNCSIELITLPDVQEE